MSIIIICCIFITVITTTVYGMILSKKGINSLEKDISATPKQTISVTPKETIPTQVATKQIISEPLTDALSRITKKPFGLKVSPSDSPVSPEKFAGYHTGVDFETTQDEQEKDIPVYALCTGSILVSREATGYGGVIVQKCTIDEEVVTVIYGHINSKSAKFKVKDEVVAGQQIAILGKGYSTETDGERKHLHLGIHKGSIVNITGYVTDKTSLDNWIDAKKYF